VDATQALNLFAARLSAADPLWRARICSAHQRGCGSKYPRVIFLLGARALAAGQKAHLPALFQRLLVKICGKK
jgi:hypothetical protein